MCWVFLIMEWNNKKMFRGIDWPCSSSVWARMVRCLFISVYPASSTTHRKHFMYYKVSESRVSHCCFTSYLKYLAESLEFSRCSKEKAMAPHSSTLAWKIPWTEEPGRLQSMGSLRVRHDWVTSLHFSLSCIGEGNGNPLQCSCLENPRDSGDWWAAVYGVAQSRTWLKQLSSSSRCLKKVFLNESLQDKRTVLTEDLIKFLVHSWGSLPWEIFESIWIFWIIYFSKHLKQRVKSAVFNICSACCNDSLSVYLLIIF